MIEVLGKGLSAEDWPVSTRYFEYLSVQIDEQATEPFELRSKAILLVMAGCSMLVVGGVSAFFLLRKPPLPPEAVVVADPILSEGRSLYLDRCVSCHGVIGKGDGPLAKSLTGPKVGDLTGKRWKHGDTPEAIIEVIGKGVQNAPMPGWNSTLGESGVRSVAAYVYFLSGREVPQTLRNK